MTSAEVPARDKCGGRSSPARWARLPARVHTVAAARRATRRRPCYQPARLSSSRAMSGPGEVSPACLPLSQIEQESRAAGVEHGPNSGGWWPAPAEGGASRHARCRAHRPVPTAWSRCSEPRGPAAVRRSLPLNCCSSRAARTWWSCLTTVVSPRPAWCLDWTGSSSSSSTRTMHGPSSSRPWQSRRRAALAFRRHSRAAAAPACTRTGSLAQPRRAAAAPTLAVRDHAPRWAARPLRT